jgi:glycosyltransferase involved in cell wall biosynthesis
LLSHRRKSTYDQRDSLAAEIPRNPQLQPLPASFTVSIVVPTRDRPDSLKECLESLLLQQSVRQREIIVVDNNPESGLTPRIIEEFPGVKLIFEHRQGASYARNAGIKASRADIIVFTDDDVVAPPQWLENIIAPLGRVGVAGVTGNILPYELDSEASILFEGYANGGLGRGNLRWDADYLWFRSHRFRAVRIWLLGGTGNAAFKSCVFADSRIGLFAEYLGAGAPSGGSEDNYLLYRVLRAGFSIAYEPAAVVWHKHRTSLEGLRQQLYGYSKGFVSYHLTTLMKDGDYRAIPSLMHLPVWHLTRSVNRLLGKSSHPLNLIAVEMLGHAAGPYSLWQSVQKVKRESQENSSGSFPVAVNQPAD